MKRFKILFLGILVFVLSACTNIDELAENEVRLPDLEGQIQSEILETLTLLDLEVEFSVRTSVELERSKEFIAYGNFLETGDIVEKGDFIPVIVSANLLDDEIYYEIQDIIYDGPYLDDSFFSLDLYEYSNTSQSYVGLGGVYEVTLNRCIDGDTTVFNYPNDIASKIESNTPSTRYFNVDTPETFPGGEEEWGKMASIYTCDLINDAESIYLQTDPGDNLIDTHGRLLAWIWIKFPEEDEYFLLNYMIVRQGLGNVAYLYGAGETDVTIYDDLTYTEWMFMAEERAEFDELGMYSGLLDYYWDYDMDAPYPGRW
ncbi:MAG: thermonuclease family protein [Candidatus Izemoplasmataceae bacterium]